MQVTRIKTSIFNYETFVCDSYETYQQINARINSLRAQLGETNAQYAVAEGFTAFRAACKKAGVMPTARQASKYRNKKGAAYKATH
jgi:hypothetical protein